MCLQIYPNGFWSGQNTHLALFINIMRGEFDDTLQWPFTGRVTIDMDNKFKQWTQIIVVNFKDYPTSGNYGYYQVLRHDQVAAEYMIENGIRHSRVHFRVNRVELV